MTSARVTKFLVGPSASSFLKPNIHDIEKFFLLRNKQGHAVRTFVRYCGLFTKILVFLKIICTKFISSCFIRKNKSY